MQRFGEKKLMHSADDTLVQKVTSANFARIYVHFEAVNKLRKKLTLNLVADGRDGLACQKRWIVSLFLSLLVSDWRRERCNNAMV